MKNIGFHFKLLTQWLNFCFSTFELLTPNWKAKNSLRITNSKVKLLFLHFWLNNSKLKNKKMHFGLLFQSWKYQVTLRFNNLKNDKTKLRSQFFVTRDFFINYWNEMLRNSQLFEKKIAVFWNSRILNLQVTLSFWLQFLLCFGNKSEDCLS